MMVSILVVLLSACGSGTYDVGYTARGDSTNILGLTESTQFRDNEDLNVVVRLTDHDGVTVAARFIDPSGNQVGDVLETEVASDVGSVVLGLDFEQMNENSGEEDEIRWQAGRWTVEISVDGESVDTLEFDID